MSGITHGGGKSVTRTTGRWFAGAATAVAVLILAATGSAAYGAPPPEGRIVVPPGAQVVKGQYIVALRQVAGASVESRATSMTRRHGGTVLRTYQAALHGFVLKATPTQARRVAADPAVALVEADTLVYPAETRPYPIWNLDRIDQRSSVLDDAYTFPDSGGAGVHAYVLDTGIRTSHIEFGGRASVGFDAIDDGWNGQDCSVSGHGTHVAGTIGGTTYGLAPNVSLVSVRVLSCAGPGTHSQVLAGIDWVTANARRPAVANMSLGGGFSPLQNQAVAQSVASGITYVVAAGNADSNACNYSPASEPTAVTVGASNSSDERARGWGGTDPGSNYGTCLDLFAPGENVRSASNVTDGASRSLRGTSMASPHVAGAAALLLAEDPTLTPAQVAQRITDASTTGTLRLASTDTSPNRLLYVGPELVSPPAADA
jgi:subtilisin family serine protease